MITAAFVIIGPVLSTKLNVHFPYKTNGVRIFLMTLVRQSALRSSGHRLLHPHIPVNTLKEFSSTSKNHLALSFRVICIRALTKAYFLRKYLPSLLIMKSS